MNDDNMVIWQEAAKTDPAYTQKFNNGTFSGTSIKPTYLFLRATEVLGPVGVGWGFDITEERFDKVDRPRPIPGTQELDWDNTITEQTHTMVIDLWHGKERHTVIGVGHTPYVYVTSKGKLTIDREYYKKTITDAVTNALSRLGFGADIRLGLHEVTEYLEEVRAEAQQKHDELAAQRRTEFAEFLSDLQTQINDAVEILQVKAIQSKARPRILREGTPEQIQWFEGLGTKRIEEMKEDASDEQSAVQVG